MTSLGKYVCFILWLIFPFFSFSQIPKDSLIENWKKEITTILEKEKISFLTYTTYKKDGNNIVVDNTVILYEIVSMENRRIYGISHIGDTVIMKDKMSKRFTSIKRKLKELSNGSCRHYVAFAETTGLHEPPNSRRFNLTYQAKDWKIVFYDCSFINGNQEYEYYTLNKIPLNRFRCQEPISNLRARNLVRKLKLLFL